MASMTPNDAGTNRDSGDDPPAWAALGELYHRYLTGLLLGMVQAATSINEQTLSFVPKLAIVALVLAIFGGSILILIVDFTQDIYARIPELLI